MKAILIILGLILYTAFIFLGGVLGGYEVGLKDIKEAMKEIMEEKRWKN